MNVARRTLRAPELLALAGILALAAALRFAGLGSESLWLDEGYSVRVASGSLREVIAGASGDIHPPLYYLLLHGWMALAGRSEAAVRTPSAIAGVITVALAWAIGRRVRGSVAGLLAAWLVALSGFQIHYAQEARSYALLAMLAALSWWFAMRAALEGRTRDRVAMTITSIAMVYTHHAGWFAVAAQALFAVAAPRFRGAGAGRAWGSWLAAHGAIVVAWLPWLGRMRAQAATVGTLGWVAPAGPRALAGTLVEMTDAPWTAFGLLVLATFAVWVALHTRERRVAIAMLALAFVVPILAPFVASRLGTPFYLTRITIAAFVPLAVLAAVGVAGMSTRGVRLAWVAILLLQIGPLVAFEQGPHRERWRDAVSDVERLARPGDRVLFDAGYCLRDAWPCYARRRDLDLRPLPAMGTATFDAEASAARAATRVWLVRSHDGASGEAIARRLAADHARAFEQRYESLTYELWRPRRYLGIRVERFDRPGP